MAPTKVIIFLLNLLEGTFPMSESMEGSLEVKVESLTAMEE